MELVSWDLMTQIACAYIVRLSILHARCSSKVDINEHVENTTFGKV